MLRRILSRWLTLIAWSFAAANAEAAVPDGWFEWPVVEPADGTALDASALNATPAGSRGRVTVKEGRFVVGDGRPLRFWGVNVTADGAFPSEADAELLARRLAKAG